MRHAPPVLALAALLLTAAGCSSESAGQETRDVGDSATSVSPDAAPPPIAPTRTPSPELQAPGRDDHPIALLEVEGGLLLATLDRVDRVGAATLWRRDAGRWQQVGTLEQAVPLHWRADSHGTRLSPGPGSQDIIARTSADDGVRFSRDGGVTWSHLAEPETCGSTCFVGGLYGEYFYALGKSYSHATTLWRAAYGATTWEGRRLPPSSGPERGFTDLQVMDDGTLVIAEAGSYCVAGAEGHYRVSRDRGDTWSERRALPGSSNCITGTDGDTLYAECGTTSCYYDTGGNGGGGGIYRSKDLVHWEPAQQPVPRRMRYGNPLYPPTVRACPRSLDVDPVYHWAVEPALRVGEEVFKLFHVRHTHGREHVLMVSRDDCRTWRPGYR